MEKQAEAVMLADKFLCHMTYGAEGRGFSPAEETEEILGALAPEAT